MVAILPVLLCAFQILGQAPQSRVPAVACYAFTGKPVLCVHLPASFQTLAFRVASGGIRVSAGLAILTLLSLNIILDLPTKGMTRGGVLFCLPFRGSTLDLYCFTTAPASCICQVAAVLARTMAQRSQRTSCAVAGNQGKVRDVADAHKVSPEKFAASGLVLEDDEAPRAFGQKGIM